MEDNSVNLKSTLVYKINFGVYKINSKESLSGGNRANITVLFFFLRKKTNVNIVYQFLKRI